MSLNRHRHTLRTLLSASVLIVAACNDTAYQTWGDHPTEPDGPMATIGGVVTDSMLGNVIPGARVAAGTTIGYADAAGQWSLDVPSGGPITVTTSPAGYERASEVINVVGPVWLNLQARRLAPAVQECVRDGDLVHALVSDLQGRKTIERWSQSEAIVVDPHGSHRVGAIDWGYQALDYITWAVTLGPVDPETSLVRWNVYDSEGHLYSGSCEPVAPGGHD